MTETRLTYCSTASGTDTAGIALSLTASAMPVIQQKAKDKAKKGSGTDHYPILSKGYGQLSDEDKEEFIRAGRAVFRAFCNSSAEEKKVYEFPASLGTAVRMHAEVLPESASISRELAIAMLTSTFENKQCIHHMMNRKQSKEAQDFYITGVEAPRVMGKKGDRRREGSIKIFECGCSEESALWDFMIWKQLNVSKWKKKGDKKVLITEAFGPMTLDPRRRLLLIDALRSWSGLELEDMYTGAGEVDCPMDAEFPAFWGHTHQHKLAVVAVERMEWKRNHLEGEIKKERKEEQEVIWDWQEAFRKAGMLERDEEELQKNGEASGSNQVIE
ncbi:hypothetical protein H0H93_009972 [Arthromyces matolae]|nr:hypothetical protein H0H93_009972 [Arthromyces matolae]